MGVITASMPSFARMLHHHLPARAELRSHLSFLSIFSQPFNKKWSRSASTGGSNTGEPRSQVIRMPHKGERAFVHLESGATKESIAKSASRFEMNTLNSMKTMIKGGQRESGDEDGIYLTHDLEHTWSSADPKNAGIGGERQ